MHSLFRAAWISAFDVVGECPQLSSFITVSLPVFLVVSLNLGPKLGFNPNNSIYLFYGRSNQSLEPNSFSYKLSELRRAA